MNSHRKGVELCTGEERISTEREDRGWVGTAGAEHTVPSSAGATLTFDPTALGSHRGRWAGGMPRRHSSHSQYLNRFT